MNTETGKIRLSRCCTGAGRALDTFCRQYCFSDKYHPIVSHLAGAVVVIPTTDDEMREMEWEYLRSTNHQQTA